MKWVKSFSVLIIIMLFIAACGSADETVTGDPSDGLVDRSGETFKVGVIPALAGDEFLEAVQKLEAVLDEALDQKVEITVYPNYNGVVEALNYGQLEMAYLGPRTYVMANHQSGAEAIITQLVDGEPYYYSYIVTHVDNPWDTLEEFLENVEERTFTFGSITSTSGSLVPGKELRERGVFDNEEVHSFKEVRFSGSHDMTGQVVQNNQIDAGAIDSAFFNQLVTSGNLDGDQFKIIWKSEKLFQYPWSVHPDVDEETVQRIVETFLAIEDKDILEGFAATGFVEASDADYEVIRQIMIDEGEIR